MITYRAGAADVSALYVGPSSGNWNLGANWSTNPAIPANSGGTTYAVTLPASKSVTFDLANPTSVNALTLNAGATLNMSLNRNLTVVNSFTGAGVINASSAIFTASGTTSVNGSSFYTSGTGSISLPGLTAYTPSTNTEFRADGATAKVNIAGLTTIDLGSSNNYMYFEANNGGMLDAHNLATITGSSTTSSPFRITSYNAGSVVDVSALTISADVLSVDVRGGGTVLWGNPTSVVGASISKTGATSVLNTASISNLDRSSVYATGGATLAFPAVTTYHPTNNNEVRADGAGSSVNLSGVTKIDLGSTNVYMTVESYNGGSVDLHNLATVAGTSSTGLPVRLQVFNPGSAVSIGSAVSTPGMFNIDIRDGGSLLWGSPTTIQGDIVSKSGAASVLNTSALSNIDHSNFYAISGATMTFPALTAYRPANGNELRADGNGSKLDYSAVTTIDLGSTNNYMYLEAFNGGNIDLHSLATISGTSSTGQPIRVQVFNPNSAVSIGSAISTPGIFNIDIRDGGSLLWGSPTTVQGDVVSKSGAGSVLNTSALSNIDRSNFYAISGATMTFPALTTYRPGNGNEMRADGSGSKLDFSAVTTIDLGSTNNYMYLEAFSGGNIDLHNLATIAGTSTTGLPIRLEVFNPGSTVSIGSAISTPGMFNIDIRDGGSLLWGSPTTVQGDVVSKSGAASVLNTSALTNIDRSNFYAVGGATMAFPALTTYRPGNGNELRADGAGSKLDMSALTTIDLGSTNNYMYLEAFNGGNLDVHNLATLSGTSTTIPPLRLQVFNANSTLSIGSIISTPGMFNIDIRDGGSLLWGSPTTIQGDIVSKSGAASTLNTSALTNIDGSNFYAAGGATMALPALTVYRPGAGNELRGDGAGSKLDLSSLSTIDLGSTNKYLYLESLNGGTLDAHNLTTIAGTSTVGTPVRIQSNGANGAVDVSSLVVGFPVGTSPLTVNFDLRNGGGVKVKEIVSADAINVTQAGSRLSVGGSVILLPSNQLTMDSGAIISTMRDFSFRNTDPNRVNASGGAILFNGTGLQRMEAGGKDVALLTNTLTNNNMSFGQLIAGQAGQPATIVEVRDDVDNGNRAGGTPEALYLFGIRGRSGAPQGGDPDAVDIQNGSTLLLRNLNVYARQGGTMVNLQTLIPAGQRITAYKGGYLSNSFSAVPGAWNVDAAGDWNTAGNWLISGVPNAAGASAVFGDKITTARTITLNTTNTVGFLGFDGANAYTISGSGAINLANAGGLRAGIHVNNDAGNANHTVNVPLNLQADLDLVSYSTGTLTLGGAFNNPSGKTIIKDGPGTIAIAGPQTHPAGTQFVTEGGTLRLDSDAGSAAARSVTINQIGGTTLLGVTQHLSSINLSGGSVMLSTTGLKSAVVSNVQFGAAGQIDLTTRNGLIVDYASGGPSPMATILAKIKSGRNVGGNAWTGPGIVSSTAASNGALAIGYAEANQLLGNGGGSFLGENVDASAVLVRATLGGDADLNGKVEFQDLVTVAQHYGQQNTTWLTGDFDYDGTTGFPDLVRVAQNYGGVLPAALPGASADFEHDLAAAFAQVPEPGICSLLLVAGAMALRRGRRHGC